jgi:flagellar export protein FliJ
MKIFRFTLQALLTLRQRQERFAMERYAHALLEREQAATKVARADHALAEAWMDLRGRIGSGCSAAAMAQALDYRRELESHQAAAVAALGVAERNVNLALQRMLDARRQREVVETCRERQQERHSREELREEMKFNDELAVRRAAALLSWRIAAN